MVKSEKLIDDPKESYVSKFEISLPSASNEGSALNHGMLCYNLQKTPNKLHTSQYQKGKQKKF